jgi:hypothetical protein
VFSPTTRRITPITTAFLASKWFKPRTTFFANCPNPCLQRAARRSHLNLVTARMPVDFVKALLNDNDKVYARWHMFEEKRDAVLAIETAVLPLMA